MTLPKLRNLSHEELRLIAEDKIDESQIGRTFFANLPLVSLEKLVLALETNYRLTAILLSVYNDSSALSGRPDLKNTLYEIYLRNRHHQLSKTGFATIVGKGLQRIAEQLAGTGSFPAVNTLNQKALLAVVSSLITELAPYREPIHCRVSKLRTLHEQRRVLSETTTGVAFNLLLLILTSDEPMSDAISIVAKLSIDGIRHSEDPWANAIEACTSPLHRDEQAERFNHYFNCCGCERFASHMASFDFESQQQEQTLMEKLIQGLSKTEISSAISFAEQSTVSSIMLTPTSDEQALANARNALLTAAKAYSSRLATATAEKAASPKGEQTTEAKRMRAS